jgi:hypothetical protein
MKSFARRALLLLLFVLLLAAPAQASGFMVGAVDDSVRLHDPVLSCGKMMMARLAGYDTQVITATWITDQHGTHPPDLEALKVTVGCANLTGQRVCLVLSPVLDEKKGYHSPNRPGQQNRFANLLSALAHNLPTVKCIVIGNEPNSQRFWRPQYDSNGKSSAPAAYCRLLARSYDTLKAIDKEILVYGFGLAPKGGDNPLARRQSHSPAIFIRECALDYRGSGRKKPLMDVFAYHPHPQSSSESPLAKHSSGKMIGLADYDQLVEALSVFDGTAQPGSSVDIAYMEFGVQTEIPPDKRWLYRGQEAPSTRPVDEATQAKYLGQALGLARCQETVIEMHFFHFIDARDRTQGWQSGVYYADDGDPSTPPIAKSSMPKVRRDIEETREATFSCG